MFLFLAVKSVFTSGCLGVWIGVHVNKWINENNKMGKSWMVRQVGK